MLCRLHTSYIYIYVCVCMMRLLYYSIKGAKFSETALDSLGVSCVGVQFGSDRDIPRAYRHQGVGFLIP